MIKNRRDFLRASGVAAIAAMFDPAAFAKDDNPNAEEHDVIAQMSRAGYKDFILLNKKNAKLYIIQNGEYFLETPVIFGRDSKGKSLTPTGVFSLTNTYNGELKPEMVFFADQPLALHSVIPGRENALLSSNIKERKKSDGCINIPEVALPFFLSFIRDTARKNPQQLATNLVVIDKDYSPPRFEKSLQEFKPQLYNPNFY